MYVKIIIYLRICLTFVALGDKKDNTIPLTVKEFVLHLIHSN